MKDVQHLFSGRKIDYAALLKNGFTKTEEYYEKTMPLSAEGNFCLRILLSENIKQIEIIDLDYGEEFSLAYTDQAVGAFVNEMRNEVRLILREIADACSTFYYFSSDGITKMVNYVKEKYGDEPEYLWDTPDDAAIRNKHNGKWYMVLIRVKADRLGFDNDEKIEIVDLHCPTEQIEKLVDYVNIFPAFHMNKKHWITLLGNDALDFEIVKRLIDQSYDMSVKNPSKRTKN